MRHHFFVKAEPPYVDPPRRELRALGAAEQAEVAARRAAVHEHLPELVPFIRDLHEAGMIDGWRGVSMKLLAEHPGEVVVHASIPQHERV